MDSPLSASAPVPDPALAPPPEELVDCERLVTEDDTPVDNFPSEKQQRLLVQTLYDSWKTPDGAPFLAAANVGLFYSVKEPALVPDLLLSTGVEVADDWWAKENRSYFMWVFGRAPELVLEIVSNQEGGELDRKMRDYAILGIPYYVVYDPQNLLGQGVLRSFGVAGPRRYQEMPDNWFALLELGLVLWEGVHEGKRRTWLRWADHKGQVIPIGAERAEQEAQRAEQEAQRAERLAARLRELGVDPDA
jgi:Uma2 family endonuclease